MVCEEVVVLLCWFPYILRRFICFCCFIQYVQMTKDENIYLYTLCVQPINPRREGMYYLAHINHVIVNLHLSKYY